MCCKQCGQDKFIVNKKYQLCDDCNFMRLHDGKTKAEVYMERNRDKPQKVYEFKRTPLKANSKPIKQSTKKQSERSTALSQLKREIEVEALQDNNYFCKGCGHSQKGLDKSHILSVKQRKDLELDKDNINLFCRQCHIDWESNEIWRMLNLNSFEKDLQYIKKHDRNRYNQLYDAIVYLVANEENLVVERSIRSKALTIVSDNDYLL